MPAENSSPPASNQGTESRKVPQEPAGPGEVGIDLSHLKTRIDDLHDDKALSRDERNLYRIFYNHTQAKLELRLSIFDVRERIRAAEQVVVIARNLLEFARSETGRQQATRKWQMQRAVESPGPETKNPHEVSQSLEKPEVEEIDKAQTQLAAAEAILNSTRTEFQSLSSNLEALSLKDDEQEKTKAAVHKWELSRRWEALTSEELRPAVAAIRHQFERERWKVEECVSKLCTIALRPPSDPVPPDNAGPHNQYRQYLLALVGPQAELLFLGPGHSAPAIFKSYLDLLEAGLKNLVQIFFHELLQIARAQAEALNMHPVEWARRHLEILILAEKTGIRLWIQRVCGLENNAGIAFSGDHDDIYCGRWRAPGFIHMQPAGNTLYDASTARTLEGLLRSQELLEGRSSRLIGFLKIELEQIVRIAHIELAKQTHTTISEQKRPIREPKPPLSLNKPSALGSLHSNGWRALHDAFRSLAQEELAQASGNKADRWLRAYVDYTNRAYDYGQWHLSQGIGEGFRNRFEVEATKAGIALSTSPVDEPSEVWLHYVFGDLKEHKSKLLAIATEEGGVINRVCEASAACCALLEKRGLVSESKIPTVSEARSSEKGETLVADHATKIDPREAQRRAVIRKVENPDQFSTLSTVEAEIYFGVSPRTIYRWIEARKLRNGGRRGTVTVKSVRKLIATPAKKRRPALGGFSNKRQP